MADKWLTVMGSFVADLAFRTPALPRWGETVLGSDFRIGPGGKGSNQAVAAARLGARVSFITKLGRDSFGDLARHTYVDAGVDTRFCYESGSLPTGAASIVVHDSAAENAIVVVPGSSFALTIEELDRAAPQIAESAVFMTQLELPMPIVEHGLALARSAGVTTILNPAPAANLPASIYALCDYLTPNEPEAGALCGRSIDSIDDARCAADMLLQRGVGTVIITLGANGALVRSASVDEYVPVVNAGPAVDTTGAGDAFNAGLAVGLTEGLDAVAAARFGCATAGISVTRHGTAVSMPLRDEVNALL